MTAPDKMPDVIWAQAEHDDDPKYGSFWIASKVARSEPYHHQRTVDELLDNISTLISVANGYQNMPGFALHPMLADQLCRSKLKIAKHRKGG